MKRRRGTAGCGSASFDFSCRATAGRLASRAPESAWLAAALPSGRSGYDLAHAETERGERGGLQDDNPQASHPEEGIAREAAVRVAPTIWMLPLPDASRLS